MGEARKSADSRTTKVSIITVAYILADLDCYEVDNFLTIYLPDFPSFTSNVGNMHSTKFYFSSGPFDTDYEERGTHQGFISTRAEDVPSTTGSVFFCE